MKMMCILNASIAIQKYVLNVVVNGTKERLVMRLCKASYKAGLKKIKASLLSAPYVAHGSRKMQVAII